MKFETLIYDVGDRIATITLNRPERLNTIVPPDSTSAAGSITGIGGSPLTANGTPARTSLAPPRRTVRSRGS
jgi:hypothetical protein